MVAATTVQTNIPTQPNGSLQEVEAKAEEAKLVETQGQDGVATGSIEEEEVAQFSMGSSLSEKNPP